MGGTDPAGLTLKAVEALAHVDASFECTVLRGPGFMHEEGLSRLLADMPGPVRVVRDGDVRAEMIASDLGVLSFGVTAYEAAACGLPAVHLSLTEDHALSSSAFGDAGIAVPLGLAEDVTIEALSQAVSRLLADADRRNVMSSEARGLVDGAGTSRVAAVLMERLGGSLTDA